MYQPNMQANTTITTGMTTTTTPTSSSTSSTSTRARAYAREAEIEYSVQTIRDTYLDIIGRKMPDCFARQTRADLISGVPSIYYSYALEEAAKAPMPSWRYVLAIVTRLRRQRVPEEDLLGF